MKMMLEEREKSLKQSQIFADTDSEEDEIDRAESADLRIASVRMSDPMEVERNMNITKGSASDGDESDEDDTTTDRKGLKQSQVDDTPASPEDDELVIDLSAHINDDNEDKGQEPKTPFQQPAKWNDCLPLDRDTLDRVLAGKLSLEQCVTRHRLWKLERNRWSEFHAQVGFHGPYTPYPPRTSRMWALGNQQLLLGNKALPHGLNWGNQGLQHIHLPTSPPAQDSCRSTNGVLTFQGKALMLLAAPDSRSKTSGPNSNALDEPLELPAIYPTVAPYLKATYSTDQDTKCKVQHVPDTVCTHCLARVLCCRIDCLECDQAIRLSVEGIVGPLGSDADGTSFKIRDILYHDLVALGEFPAASNSRFPLHRLVDYEDYKDLWGRRYPRSKASNSIGANPTYNATRRCRQCHSTHTYIGRKLAAAYYLPRETKYDDVVHAREPGRLVPRMTVDFREDESGPYRHEPFSRCPRGDRSWLSKMSNRFSPSLPSSPLGRFIKIVQDSVNSGIVTESRMKSSHYV